MRGRPRGGRRLEPGECPRMLGDDHGEEGVAQRVRLALELAEAIDADVRVLGRIDDIAPVGELGAEAVVDRLHARVDDRLGRPLQPVLADDHGPSLARLQVPGQEQDARGVDVGDDGDPHGIAGPDTARHVDLLRENTLRGLPRDVEGAYQFLGELSAIRLARRLPRPGRLAVGPGPGKWRLGGSSEVRTSVPAYRGPSPRRAGPSGPGRGLSVGGRPGGGGRPRARGRFPAPQGRRPRP